MKSGAVTFQDNLWIWTSLQTDQSLMSVFLCQRYLIKAFHFQTAIESGE